MNLYKLFPGWFTTTYLISPAIYLVYNLIFSVYRHLRY